MDSHSMSPAVAGPVAPSPKSDKTKHRPFWALFLLGMLGVLSLPLTLIPELHRLETLPDSPPIPVWVLAVLSLIQPTVLLAASTALGLRFAPRLGLVSYVHERTRSGVPVGPRLRSDLRVAVSAGVVVAVSIALLDALFVLYLGEPVRNADPVAITMTLVGLLYGGITEEIMVRWGLLSLFAWAAWRLVQRGQGTPHASLMMAGIIFTAILFGIGHLPGIAAVGPLSPLLVLRTVSLNALGGTVFGWLFWRRSLEAAMLAHATTHIVFTALGAAI